MSLCGDYTHAFVVGFVICNQSNGCENSIFLLIIFLLASATFGFYCYIKCSEIILVFKLSFVSWNFVMITKFEYESVPSREEFEFLRV